MKCLLMCGAPITAISWRRATSLTGSGTAVWLRNRALSRGSKRAMVAKQHRLTSRSEPARAGNALRATSFAPFHAHSSCRRKWKRRTSKTSYLVHLSTIADAKISDRPWVNIQSAGGAVFNQRQQRANARASIQEYIEIFCNRQRRHSRLGFLSPALFAETLKQALAA